MGNLSTDRQRRAMQEAWTDAQEHRMVIETAADYLAMVAEEDGKVAEWGPVIKAFRRAGAAARMAAEAVERLGVLDEPDIECMPDAMPPS